MGLGPSSLKAHKPLIGNDSYVGPEMSSPRVFEAGDCSKTSHPRLGPSQLNCDLAVFPSSPSKEKDVVPFAMIPMCSKDSSLPPGVHVKSTMDTAIISASALLLEVQMSVNQNIHTFPEPMHVADVS